MKANNDVTEALRRTINLMQGELERSVLSTQLLGICLRLISYGVMLTHRRCVKYFSESHVIRTRQTN